MAVEAFLTKHNIASSQVILGGFAGVILIGAFLLMLPVSSASHCVTPFCDALFTSTSAVCVTGLVVHDTATYWSLFGQIVIMILIQIGGIGVVSLVTFMTMLVGGRIGLLQRNMIKEAVGAPQIGGVVRTLGSIFKNIFLFELSGAVLLSTVFIRDFGVLKGIYYGIFHSISAFCNAGFDLMGVREPYSSLTSYADNPVVNLTIMALIITGGIGFLTWLDLRKYGLHFSRWRLQTKLIITTTAILILVPAACFYFAEFTDGSAMSRLLRSLFQTVTPRTAGFNTVSLSDMKEPGQFLMVLLMLAGGAPGSTAGGIKVTTVAILAVTLKSALKRKANTECFGRSIHEEDQRMALIILLIYSFLMIAGSMAISAIDSVPMLSTLYESASALNTVGLTLGLTPTLSVPSRLILILLMYAGRVGGMTFVYAVLPHPVTVPARKPAERVMVG